MTHHWNIQPNPKFETGSSAAAFVVDLSIPGAKVPEASVTQIEMGQTSTGEVEVDFPAPPPLPALPPQQLTLPVGLLAQSSGFMQFFHNQVNLSLSSTCLVMIWRKERESCREKGVQSSAVYLALLKSWGSTASRSFFSSVELVCSIDCGWNQRTDRFGLNTRQQSSFTTMWYSRKDNSRNLYMIPVAAFADLFCSYTKLLVESHVSGCLPTVRCRFQNFHQFLQDQHILRSLSIAPAACLSRCIFLSGQGPRFSAGEWIKCSAIYTVRLARSAYVERFKIGPQPRSPGQSSLLVQFWLMIIFLIDFSFWG